MNKFSDYINESQEEQKWAKPKLEVIVRQQ